MTTMVPDMVLPGGYTMPPHDAVNFVVYPEGYDPGAPTTRTLRIIIGVRYRSAGTRVRAVDAVWAPLSALRRTIAAQWQAADSMDGVTRARWGSLPACDAVAAASWRTAIALSGVVTSAPWHGVKRADHGPIAAGWASARAYLDASAEFPWAPVYPRDAATVQPWRAAALPTVFSNLPPIVVRQTESSFVRLPRGDRLVFSLLIGSVAANIHFALARRVLMWPRLGRPLNFILPAATNGNADFVLSGSPSYAPSLDRVVRPGYTVPARLNAMLGTMSRAVLQWRVPTVLRYADPVPFVARWGELAKADSHDVIRWGRGPQYRRPDPPPITSPWQGSSSTPPPILTARKVYIVMNDVQVVRLPDGTPIEVLSVDLDASVDAWCWSVRMELQNMADLVLLKPDGNGPKMVQITMNGYLWTAIIEGWERSTAFANAGITVVGRSRTALLSSTYTASRSMAFTDPYNAQQLANLEISQRALAYTIDWNGLDWLVPAGAWYYQDLAPMDVIAQIAAARGAVVQSDPTDAKLIVQSRYPLSPWQWSANHADVALSSSWVSNISAQQQSKPMYDAVIIAGQSQGILTKVTRVAAAGETFAAQVVDQLIVAPDVATERGRNILSDRGIQEQVSMDIPLFAAGDITGGMPGLYTPLLLVDVQDPADPFQGQSVGVSISARRGGPDSKALEIMQHVSLERHLSDAN